MLPRRVGTLFVFLIAHSIFAADAVSLRFEGRGLTPGDKFTVSPTLQYVVFDPARKPSTARPDGAKALDESMVEFRETSAGKATWTMTVPKDGRYSGKVNRLPFRQSIKVIPDRITAYIVSIVFSRNTVAPDGKPVSFTREQSFPVEITASSIPKELCVVFEGASGGMLTIGVRPKCSDTVAPEANSRSIPRPRD